MKRHLDRQDGADQHRPAGRRAPGRFVGTRVPSPSKPSSLSNPECSLTRQAAHTVALTARDSERNPQGHWPRNSAGAWKLRAWGHLLGPDCPSGGSLSHSAPAFLPPRFLFFSKT